MNVGPAKAALFLLTSCALVQQAFCAELPAGRVVWWGEDDFWKSCYSTHTNGLIEHNNEFLTNVIAVAGRQWQGLALRSDGTVFGFGHNIFGGNDVPAGLSNVVSIAVEGNSCWAIRRDGTVARWGSSDQDDANIVAGLSNITSIAWGGYRNYLALKKDGTLAGFRFDAPDTEKNAGLIRSVRFRGQILSNIVAVASMGYTPLVLKGDGEVFSLRCQTPGVPPVQPQYEAHDNVLYEYLGGESAQLPYRYTSADPVIVNGRTLSNVVALASGEGHHLALKRDGTVVAWGNDTYGATAVPTGLSNVIAIAAAEHQSLALKRDGTVVSWGANYASQNYVPAGLSNVVAIAAAMDFNMAVTAGNPPSSVFIQPHGRLEEMSAESDLVFKGQVISSSLTTNAAFPDWGSPHATRLEVISVLKGDVGAKTVEFRHNAHGPNAWSGGTPPPYFILNVGESYIIFAVKADKPDWLYSPSSNYVARPNEFRQLMRGVTPIHTLDARPLDRVSLKEAHWLELNLLLQDSNSTNQLYAIDQLDRMSFADRQDDRWLRSEDFKRESVLIALLPLVTNSNEQVASRAISCFSVESNSAMLEPFADPLIKVANSGPSSSRRLNAIGALSGTHFEAVSNSLAHLLKNSDENVRAGAVGLLTHFPGDFSEQALRECAMDESPKVRATVADAIGNGRITNLLPTLEKLLSDPIGQTNPIPPLTIEDLQEGGHTWGNNNGDVHTSAGYAILKFDVDQVSNILMANLNDAGFRPNYLCKLAEKNAGPWFTNLVQLLEARRDRIWKEVETSGVEPKTNYYQARMTLAGTYYQCWNIIYNYLHELPSSEFAGSNLDRCLDVLENAGNTGSPEPTKLYELYRLKGLEKRAAEFRRNCEKTFSYDMSVYFNRVDSQFTNSLGNANQR